VRALTIVEPGVLELGELEDPRPGADEVVVEVGACGVCGTDLHLIDGESPLASYPLVPGHEFSGVVVARGNGVEEPALGQRIAVDPNTHCGACRFCRSGRANLCTRYSAVGVTGPGAFAQFVKARAANAYCVSDALSAEQAAMIEPLSCAVLGVRQVGEVLGRRTLVVGAGTMGLLIGQLLAAMGASEVAIVDPLGPRLEVAAELGLGPCASSTEEFDTPFEVAVDATGLPEAVEAAFDAVDRGGTLLVFGVADVKARIGLSPFRIFNDEITVKGSMAVLNSFGTAVRLMETGQVNVLPLLGAPFPLEEYNDALTAMRSGAGRGIKTQIAP
jgi:2-desacetyl-2-hydroxyethyl bacteriochlorophyllide A dehydrogenase